MTIAPTEFPVAAAAPARRGAWRQIRRHPTIAAGAVLLMVMVAMALLAPWLGTVMLGRDVYSRTIYGARISLIVGLSVAVFSTALGLVIGVVTGFVRWIDAIVMRIMDGLMSIPAILIAIALMALTRASLGNVIFAITVAEVPRVTRLVRGVVLTLREQPYVEAALASGTGIARILSRHIVPNTLTPLLVNGTFIVDEAMITEAILSFLGAGTPPNIPSWGNIIAEGRA